MASLKDRHVVVLGGTSGIGYAVAEGCIAAVLSLVVLYGAAAFRLLRARLGPDPLVRAGCLGALAAVLVTWTTDTSPRYVQVSAPIAALVGISLALGSRPGRRTVPASSGSGVAGGGRILMIKPDPGGTERDRCVVPELLPGHFCRLCGDGGIT